MKWLDSDATGRRRASAIAGVAILVLAGACSGSSTTVPPVDAAAKTPAGARSTADPRVRSFAGTVPPDVFTNGTWVGRADPTSLTALRGRVVCLVFAFPT